ncbi:MAG: ATP-binding cassette domain-containing protein, partial [Pseudoflavonifractor sp.]
EKPSFGTISVKNKPTVFTSPKAALDDGILMIPKERLFEGIVATLPVEENIALSNAKALARGPVVSSKAVRKQAEKWIETLKIKTSGPKELLMQLSGGNQQKVVFSRALASGADVLILNHPTRGVDVGAKEEIYALIRDMTAEGKAVILLGDTLDECIGLSSRLLVMKDGLITGEFEAPADHKPSQVDVVSLMM